MENNSKILDDMNGRTREVFRRIVESYLENGEPMGSRTLSRSLSEQISSATIRNVMQDLEFLGLLDSPHISAGRIPSELGLRMFVDGLLEVNALDQSDREKLNQSVRIGEGDVAETLDRIGSALSGLTQSASLVLTPKQEEPIKHIDFVSLAPDRVLVVLVFANGEVENRLFTPPLGQTPSALRQAANFLNSLIEGRTLSEVYAVVSKEVAERRQEIDELAKGMVEKGIAVWQDRGETNERLIVRGRSNLLEPDTEEKDIERVKSLFDDLERKQDIADFLDLTEKGDGVRIFIGSENKLFSLSGSSLVVSSYMNADLKVIGAIGVIGPKRLNYGRIVPIVDYTAQLVGKIISDRN
ncbi:heat-inducible transcriptional repressor HrcA [Paracoccaceae bacterium]|nr:heat-inducible transcriptional repressor HrcA [Paracoccaceae bacterium]